MVAMPASPAAAGVGWAGTQQPDAGRIAAIRSQRAALQAIYNQTNALRAEATRCRLPDAITIRLSAAEECNPKPKDGSPEALLARNKREETCLANMIPLASQQLVNERATYRRASTVTKIKCRGLVATVLDEACDAFPNACELMMEGKACYDAASAAKSAGLKTFGKTARFFTSSLNRLSLASIKNLFRQMESAARDVRTAITGCWAFFKHAATEAVAAVKNWFCGEAGSTGAVICERIREGRACYLRMKGALGGVPMKAATQIRRLSILETANPFSIARSVYDSFGSPEMSAAVSECAKWAKQTIVAVAGHVCKKSEGCAALLEALEREGITVDNWRSRKLDIARIAMRTAFRKEGSVTIKLGANIAVPIFRFIGVMGEGELSVTVTHAGDDVYDARFAVKRTGEVTAGYEKGQTGASIGIGGSIEDGRTFRINAADPNDWRLLLMLAADSAVRALARSAVGPLAQIPAMPDVIGSIEKLLIGEPINANAIIAKLGRESSCKLCGILDGSLSFGFGKPDKGVQFSAGGRGELCFGATHSRSPELGKSALDLAVETNVTIMAGAELGKDLVASVSKGLDQFVASAKGTLAKIGAWWAAHNANDQIEGTLDRLGQAQLAVSGALGKRIENLTGPTDRLLACGELAKEFVTKWANPSGALTFSWSLGYVVGKTQPSGVTITLSTSEPIRAVDAIDASLLGFGPIGAFALFLKNGRDAAPIDWRVRIDSGRVAGTGVAQDGVRLTGKVEATRSYTQGIGRWTLGDLRNAPLTGTLGVYRDVRDGKCAPNGEGRSPCDRRETSGKNAPPNTASR